MINMNEYWTASPLRPKSGSNIAQFPIDTPLVLRLVKTHMGKCLFSPELKSYLITQWNCTTIGSCRCRKSNQWVGSGAARTYGDNTRQIPAETGGVSGYISGRFAIGSSDFFLLQRRRLRLHWSGSLLAVDTPRSRTQRPRSARLIRLQRAPTSQQFRSRSLPLSGDHIPSETDGNPHSQLPRRLAHSGPVRGGTTFTQNPHPQPLRAPGAQGQFRQKRTVSQPTNIVPGYSSGLSSHESGDSARTRSGHSETRGHLQERHRSPTQSVSKNAGPYGRSIASVTAGPAPHAPPSTLVETTGSTQRMASRTLAYQGESGLCNPRKNPRWMEKGVAMGLVHNRKVVTTDASNSGWGALCEGKPTFGHWSKTESGFYINCLEMLAVCRACQFFLPDLIGRHVLIRSDNMSVVSYINHQGGVSSKRLFILAERLLEWAQLNLRSLRAAHLPGRLNQGADVLSRSNVPSEERMLHPQVVQKIWKNPWPVPLRRDLLSHANGTIWHPWLELWALDIWPLNGSLLASQSEC